MPKSWFAIKNATAETAEISIYDVIGLWGISARSFIAQLKAITAKKIDLRIHSPGGDVFEGHAIFNALQRHPAVITSHIDGLAASMASVVALAGKTVNIAANGMIMIHNPSGGSFGGTADEHRKSAELLDKVREVLVNAYEEKTGLARTAIEKMMDDETWMTAKEAKDFGFVDAIGPEMKAAALGAFDLAGFRNVPDALRVDNPTDEMKLLNASIAALFATATGAKITEDSTEAEVKAALDGLAGKVGTLTTVLATANGKVGTLTTDLATANGKVGTLTTDLATANGKITDLEAKSKTAEEKAREIAAQHGSAGTPKTPESAGAGAGDGKKHFDAYQAAMDAGKGREASEIMAAHEKAITAHVATLTK